MYFKTINLYLKILLILSIFSVLFANKYQIIELENRYFFSNPNIYSTDILTGIKKNFLIAKIPNNINVYKIPSKKIKDIFLNNGYKALTSVNFITFKKELDIDKNKIKNFIKDKYTEIYKNLHIENIEIKSNSYVDLKGFFIDKLEISHNRLNYDHGSLRVSLKNNLGNQKSIYLKYKITAYIFSLKATANISKDELISKNTNIKLLKTDFKDHKKALVSLEENTYYARHKIHKGALLYQRYLKKKPLVKKNDVLIVVFRSDFVRANRSAIALSDGYKNDIISIKIDDKKRKAKVISKNKVEIQ